MTESNKPIGVLFATKEGHTKKIAEHIADNLTAKGFPVQTCSVRDFPVAGDLKTFAAVILAASVHVGQHEKEMIQFVRRHRADLDLLPTAFISVTLSQAGAERPTATVDEHARFVADVEKVLHQFFEDTHWRPGRIKPVAGALLYSKYNFLIRFVMKRIAKKAGAETDTSRDYIYTDWAGLDRFVEDFINETRILPESVTFSLQRG
jgi:menaquinone-dependent protoporphyrinogen oxidase